MAGWDYYFQASRHDRRGKRTIFLKLNSFSLLRLVNWCPHEIRESERLSVWTSLFSYQHNIFLLREGYKDKVTFMFFYVYFHHQDVFQRCVLYCVLFHFMFSARSHHCWHVRCHPSMHSAFKVIFSSEIFRIEFSLKQSKGRTTIKYNGNSFY